MSKPEIPFWKMRSKNGRDKIFSSPEMLWQSACEYFEATDNRKWTKKDWVGKDATQVERKFDTPYTMTGLALFLDVDIRTLRNYGTNEVYKDFFPIYNKIKEVMYTQKFEGAAVGAFSQNIIARELGLSEKTNQEVTVTQPIIIDWKQDETNE